MGSGCSFMASPSWSPTTEPWTSSRPRLSISLGRTLRPRETATFNSVCKNNTLQDNPDYEIELRMDIEDLVISLRMESSSLLHYLKLNLFDSAWIIVASLLFAVKWLRLFSKRIDRNNQSVFNWNRGYIFNVQATTRWTAAISLC